MRGENLGVGVVLAALWSLGEYVAKGDVRLRMVHWLYLKFKYNTSWFLGCYYKTEARLAGSASPTRESAPPWRRYKVNYVTNESPEVK